MAPLPPQFTSARRGRVYVRDGSFTMENEALTEGYSQKPQFLPRAIWPEDPAQGENHRPAGMYNFPIDWHFYRAEALEGLANLREQVAQGYPEVQPMPSFEGFDDNGEVDWWAYADQEHMYTTTRGNVDGLVWPHHVAVVHGILNDAIPRDRMLRDWEMSSLIAIMTYGIADAVTYIPGSWRLTGPHPRNDNPYVQQPLNNIGDVNNAEQGPLNVDVEPTCQNVFRSHFDPDFGMELRQSRQETPTFSWEGNPPDEVDELDLANLRRRVNGHRWVIVPIKQTGAGWTMTIFDRSHAQLYIFDPCMAAREERTEAIVHAWTRWWMQLGMVGHFTYFVPKVWVPKDGYDRTGLLSIHWLLMTLRNQVGPFMEQNDFDIETRDILIQPYPDRHIDPEHQQFRQRLMMHTSSIPLPNWAPRFVENLNRGEAEVKRVIKIIICNELGLWDHPVMNERPQSNRVNAHNVIDRLRPEESDDFQNHDPNDLATFVDDAFHYCDDSVVDNNPARPKFFTAYGGPQFALPLALNIRSLDQEAANPPPRMHPVVHNDTERWLALPNDESPLPPENPLITGPVTVAMRPLYNGVRVLRKEMLQSEYRANQLNHQVGANDLIYNTTLHVQGRFFRNEEGQIARGAEPPNLWFNGASIEGSAQGLGLQQHPETLQFGYLVRLGAHQIVNPATERPALIHPVSTELFFPIDDDQIHDAHDNLDDMDGVESGSTSSDAMDGVESESTSGDEEGDPADRIPAVQAMNRQMRRNQLRGG
jgi:hypothetical protein